MSIGKVSILMTVYNRAQLLRESIPPLINQTYRDYEVVIINDGSTDQSGCELIGYEKMDQRIKVINRPENKGRAYSLNEGLSLCSGDYIAINDADDISKTTRLEEMVSFIENKGIENEFGIVGSASIIEDRKNNIVETYRVKTGTLSDRVSIARIFMGMPFIHSSFIYNKKALFSVGGFANEVTSAIDYFTLVKICRRYPVYAYNKATVKRIVDGDNFFLQTRILKQQDRNDSIINEWKKSNFKASPVYFGMTRLNEIRKRILAG